MRGAFFYAQKEVENVKLYRLVMVGKMCVAKPHSKRFEETNERIKKYSRRDEKAKQVGWV